MSLPLTKKTVDHSGFETFSFSFYCDICGKEWKSQTAPFESGGLTEIEHDEARQLLWAYEHRNAFEQANLDARMQFNGCPLCKRRVCDDCFTCKEGEQGVCIDCNANEK